MPIVNGKKFPYSAKGLKKAKREEMKVDELKSLEMSDVQALLKKRFKSRSKKSL